MPLSLDSFLAEQTTGLSTTPKYTRGRIHPSLSQFPIPDPNLPLLKSCFSPSPFYPPPSPPRVNKGRGRGHPGGLQVGPETRAHHFFGVRRSLQLAPAGGAYHEGGARQGTQLRSPHAPTGGVRETLQELTRGSVSTRQSCTLIKLVFHCWPIGRGLRVRHNRERKSPRFSSLKMGVGLKFYCRQTQGVLTSVLFVFVPHRFRHHPPGLSTSLASAPKRTSARGSGGSTSSRTRISRRSTNSTWTRT